MQHFVKLPSPHLPPIQGEGRGGVLNTTPPESCHILQLPRKGIYPRGDINYHEPILLPNALKSSNRVTKYKTGQLLEKSYMKVFPNPAKQFVIVEYNLQEKYSDKNEVVLVLTNLNGNRVSQRVLVKRQDQELINTSGLIPGIYICSLWINGKILESKKLVVIE